ncbi:MAG: ABC transporter ATP-binding protein/permease [Flavobacteriales bacterium]|nr:ABC transporter ATP-binding protein/permease [Flavobacteriales bacterium]MDW8432848.1 ABC transporter ATP-binding protein [Flavobacteriales bacterium]
MYTRFFIRLHDLLGWPDTSAVRYETGNQDLTEPDFIAALTESAAANVSAISYIPLQKETESYAFLPGQSTHLIPDLRNKRVFIIQKKEGGKVQARQLNFAGNDYDVPLAGEGGQEIREAFHRAGGFYVVYPPETVGLLEEGSHNPQADPLRKLLQLLKLDKQDIYRLYTYAVAGGLLSLALPLGIQSIINLVMGARLSASLIFLIGVVLMAVFLSGLMQILQLQITESLRQKIFLRSAFEYARRAPAFAWREIKNRYMPEQMNRFFDSLTIQKGIPKLLMDFTTALLQVIFGIILLSFYHPLFLFLSIALVAALIFVFRVTYKPGLKAGLQTSKYKYLVAFWLEEVARAAAAFKLAGDSYLPIQKMDFLLGKYLSSRKKYFGVLLTQFWYFIGFRLLITGTLLIAGSLLVINETINLGQFVASEIVIILILNATEKLITTAETFFDVAIGTEKLLAVVELPCERRNGFALSRPEKGSALGLRFEQVCFREAKSGVLELDNVTFEVQPGEKVALFTTDERYGIVISELLSGLENPTSGQIYIEDMPLQNISLRSLRRHVAGVFIYDSIIMGNVIDNIQMGRQNVSLKKTEEVAQKLNLRRHMQYLENGLETELLPQDRTVSQILLRKILLARALVEEAGLLLIEDFDTRNFGEDGAQIQSVLLNDRSFTLLAGTHDRRMMVACDKLLWIQKGRIRYFGAPEAILSDPELNELLG